MSLEEVLERAQQLLEDGDEAAARNEFRRVSVLAREVFAPHIEAQAMLALGSLFVAAEDLLSAQSTFQEAIARSMEAGDRLLEADAHLALAHTSFDLGQSKHGHESLLEAMVIYRQHDSEQARRNLARATRVYGEHIAVLGSAEDAREALILAQLMFRELGDEAAAGGIEEDLQELKEYER